MQECEKGEMRAPGGRRFVDHGKEGTHGVGWVGERRERVDDAKSEWAGGQGMGSGRWDEDEDVRGVCLNGYTWRGDGAGDVTKRLAKPDYLNDQHRNTRNNGGPEKDYEGRGVRRIVDHGHSRLACVQPRNPRPIPDGLPYPPQAALWSIADTTVRRVERGVPRRRSAAKGDARAIGPKANFYNKYARTTEAARVCGRDRSRAEPGARRPQRGASCH